MIKSIQHFNIQYQNIKMIQRLFDRVEYYLKKKGLNLYLMNFKKINKGFLSFWPRQTQQTYYDQDRGYYRGRVIRPINSLFLNLTP